MSLSTDIGPTSTFPLNQPKRVVVEGRPLCVVHTDAGFFAVDDSCTHAEASLSAGEVNGDEIICPRHGAAFSLRDGTALTLPATQAVRCHRIHLQGERVTLSSEESR